MNLVRIPAAMILLVCAACSGQPAEKTTGGSAALAPAAATDWPNFLGPTHNAQSAETGLLKSFPAGGPPVVWKIETGATYACPSVARGVLVLFHLAGDQETVEGRDAKTGKPIWKFSYPARYSPQYGDDSGPRCTPTISGDRVFTLSPTGELHALALATGKLLWKRQIVDDFRPAASFFGCGSTPVVEGDKLLINAGGADGAGVVALNTSDGATAWKTSNEGASYSTPIVTTVNGKRLAFFLTRHGAACVDPAAGKLLWSVPFKARIAASVHAATPVVAGDHVFYTSSYGTGGLYLRVGDGAPTEVWRDDVLASHFATPIHRDGYLYGFDDRFDGPASNLRCVELKTGKLMWKKADVQSGMMIFADGRFWIIAEGRLILAELSPQGFKEISSASVLSGRTWTLPVLSGGHLYLRNAGTLMCLDVRGK